MSIKLIMPMAGTGTRFVEAGYTEPKPLIKIKGVPMFQYAETQIGINFDERIFIVRKDHNIADTIKSLYPTATTTVIELDEDTEGTACTLLKAKSLFTEDDSVFVANCDQSVVWDRKLAKQIVKSVADGAIATFINDEKDPKWSFAKEVNGIITEVAEKNPISNKATVGYYWWRDATQMFRNIEQMIKANDRVNGEFYTCPVFNYTIKEGSTIFDIPVMTMKGLGTPEDLESYLNEN